MILSSSSIRGFILPIALFFILAMSATSMAALIMARTELLSELGDHHYLRRRVVEEHAGTQESESGWTPLPGGYRLAGPPDEGGLPGSRSVYWKLRPDSVASHLLPGALEFGQGPAPAAGVMAMSYEQGCPPPYGRPLLRLRSESGPPPDPPLPLPPRIGPVGIIQLLELAEISLALEGPFPVPESDLPQIMRAPAGIILSGGSGTGILLGEGDLVLSGGTHFMGIVLTRGSLRMEGGARIEGVALVGAGVTLTGASAILGCPGAATLVLDHPALTVPHPISGGAILGRF